MRTTAWLLPVGLVLAVVGGCSSSRFGLAKSDSPAKKPKDADVVEYGNPWKKPKKEQPVEPQALPPELEKLKQERLAAKNQPADLAPWLKNAAVAESKGEFGAAKELYKKIIDKDPNNAEAHHRLAVIADQQQDPQTADVHYQTALKLNRRDADLLSDMGYSLYLRGKFEESESRLKEALEANPYHRGAQGNLGLVYGRQGKYDLALAAFRQAGTESEAQRNMAKLFPNGRPDGSTTPNSGPAIAEMNRRAAPAMPADVDQTLAGASIAEVKARMQQEREAAIRTRQEQQQREFRPEVTSLDPPSMPPGRNTNPPAAPMANNHGMANANPAWPSMTTPPPATFNPANMNSGSAATNSAALTNVAKPADSSPFWTGNRGNAPAGSMPNAMGMPPEMNAGLAQNMGQPNYPTGNFSNSMPNANQGTAWNSQPNGNPAAGWGRNDFAQPATGANSFGANGNDFQQAGFSDFAQPNGAPPGTMNEASRMAAQMAMTTGPGGLLPVVNAGPVAANSYRPNNTNGVGWAYGESSGPPNRNVENAVYTRTPGSDRASPTANTTTTGDSGNSFAPGQPWGDWQSPAPAPINWQQNEPANNGTANPPPWNPNGAGMNPAPTNSLPPWSGNGGRNSSTTVDDYRWNDFSNNAQPGNTNRSDAASNGNFGGSPTTVPNWPHAPNRP